MEARQGAEELRTITLLQQCEANITRLKIKLEEQENIKTHLEKTLSNKRSQTAPIKRIPPEVLLKVFAELLVESPLALGPVLLVCSRWNRIATGQSLLWSTISLRLDANASTIQQCSSYAKSAIHYSRKLPLDVTIDFPSSGAFVYHLSSIVAGAKESLPDSLRREFGSDLHKKIYQGFLNLSPNPDSYNFRSLMLYGETVDALEDHHSLNEFSEWLNYRLFHYPTPILELVLRDEEWLIDGSDKVSQLFIHPAPRLSRINSNLARPGEHLPAPGENLSHLQLSFYEWPLNAFLSRRDFSSLKFLCILDSADISTTQEVNLPQLEELTIVDDFSPHLINAPRLLALYLLGTGDYYSYFSRGSRFPLLRKLHLGSGSYQINGRIEVFRGYIDQIPLLNDIGIWSGNKYIVKRFIQLIKKGGIYNRISIKGYEIQPSELYWDYSPREVELEKYEIQLDD